jgi:transcriptional regulator with XRE-family HTH domain
VEASEIPELLKKLRVATGMSAAALGRRTGFSQSKVSKIENGTYNYVISDLRKLLDALDPEASIRRSVLHAAIISRDASMDQTACLVDYEQFTELEESARTMKVVERDFIPLWFQSTSYTRHAFDWFGTRGSVKDFMANKEARKTKSESVSRQNVCIITEEVLLRRMLPPAEWLEQLHLLEDRLGRPGVELGIIPLGVTTDEPIASWASPDDSAVLLEARMGGVDTLVVGKAEVHACVSRMDDLAALAVWGGSAIQLIRDSRRRLTEIDLRAERVAE